MISATHIPRGARPARGRPGRLLAAAIFTGLVLAPPSAAALPAASPTGRTPRLLWTPERQAVWNRMRAENHPWWALARRKADQTATAAQGYGDHGQWATFVYQVTGDRAYAEKALTVLRKEFASTTKKSPNFTREYGAEYAVLYDWLLPAMSADDRAAFIAMLNRWADDATSNPWNPNFPIRTDDSDQTIGNYFQFAFLALATAGDNPRADEFLNRSYVGGLVSTRADRSTLRNAIRQYAVQMAEGGQWMEGSEYNMGTPKLLLMGVEGVLTATGREYFPEVRALLPRLALGQIYELTPDLRQGFQWGDIEHPRDLLLLRRVTYLGMLQGLLQETPEGACVNQLIDDLIAQYGFTGYRSAEPRPRIFYLYNPYAPRAGWKDLPPHFTAAGQGISFYRTPDALLGLHFPTRQPFIDHEVRYFGDFQLYRRGEWAITHPLGYLGPPNGGEGTNAMLIAGLSSMHEVKGIVAQEADPNGRFLYAAGTTAGQYYRLPYYQPPRPFLEEWTRSFFYLPSRDGRSDTVIVHDRVNAGPVLDLAHYGSTDRTRIEGAAARKQWVLHMPVPPTLAPDTLSWSTPGGQQVKVCTLLPANPRRAVIDEDAAWPDAYPYPIKAEQKWQVRVMPPVDQQWDTFLNVVQAFDAGATLQNRLVRATDGSAEGVLVQRGGHEDALVLFSASPAARVLQSGYSVNWTAGTRSTELYLVDLSPARTWTVSIDGGRGRQLSVSGQGVARVTVSGRGRRSLKLTAR